LFILFSNFNIHLNTLAYSSVVPGETDKEKTISIPSNGTIEEIIQIKPKANTIYILVNACFLH